MCLWVPCRAVPSTTGLSAGVRERCTLPSGLARTGTPPAHATWSRLSPCIACRIHKATPTSKRRRLVWRRCRLEVRGQAQQVHSTAPDTHTQCWLSLSLSLSLSFSHPLPIRVYSSPPTSSASTTRSTGHSMRFGRLALIRAGASVRQSLYPFIGFRQFCAPISTLH